jgi:hypothetical protein
MENPEHLALLMRMAIRNGQAIDVLFGVANDFACLVEAGLERCARTGCREPATVQQVDLNVRMCDACAAAAIVRATKNINTDHRDALNLVRTRIANDDCWLDLPDAVRVRRIRDYVLMLKKNDEPDPPRFDQMH